MGGRWCGWEVVWMGGGMGGWWCGWEVGRCSGACARAHLNPLSVAQRVQSVFGGGGAWRDGGDHNGARVTNE